MLGGGQSKLPSLLTNINGSSTSLTSAYSNIDGIQKQIFQAYVPLNAISVGSVVQFNTTLSGSDKPTKFIVLGKSKAGDSILLLQKYIYRKIVFSSTNTSEYSTSDIDKYLSGGITESNSYRYNFNAIIENCLVKTTIDSYSCNSSSILKLSRDIFLMSYTEAGFTDYAFEAEGKSYLDSLKIATETSDDNIARITTAESVESTVFRWWLRSPYNTSYVNAVGTNGNNGRTSAKAKTQGCRPILSFDPTTLVDTTTTIPTIVGK